MGLFNSSLFKNVYTWPKQLLHSDSRNQLLDDIKHGDRQAEIGTPLHGISAGIGLTKLGSAYRGKQAYDRLKDGQDPFSSEFIKGLAGDQWDNANEAFRENWPVLAVMAGNAAGDWGGGGAGEGDSLMGLNTTKFADSSAGTGIAKFFGVAGGASNYGNLANTGMGLLNQSQQQPQQPGGYMPQANPQSNEASRMRMAQEVQLQALRQKPNKTLDEWAALANAIQAQGLLGDPYA